jgi:hypothetical protein
MLLHSQAERASTGAAPLMRQDKCSGIINKQPEKNSASKVEHR